jgi:enterochelin esterase-like enzyme
MKPSKRFFTASLLVLFLFLSAACRIGLVLPTPTYNASHTPTASAAQVSASASPTGKLPRLPDFTTTPTATATPAPAIQVEIQHGKITSQALAGNLLGDPSTRDYYVLLPPGYTESAKRYPVVYFLHQFGGKADTYLAEIQEVYSHLLSTGATQEMIIAFPDASNKLGGSWYLSSPTIGDYETYITQEFVGLIDARYRTLPSRESRGLTGCSMGSIGSLHLAFKYPQVFSVAAGVSGYYDKNQDPILPVGAELFKGPPKDFKELAFMPPSVQIEMAEAAGAAPNPNNPPFYLDMPYQLVNNETQIVESVIEKEKALDPLRAAMSYLEQPLRLRGLMVYHGIQDPLIPVETARLFDKQLTRLGIPHNYLEVDGNHCNLDFTPVLKFESASLVPEISATATP